MPLTPPKTRRADRDRLDTLARWIDEQQDALLSSWRLRVAALPSAHRLDTPTLDDHMPRLLTELAAALRADATPPRLPPEDGVAASTPTAHGLQRLDVGLDIEEVVAEYGALRHGLIDHAEAAGHALRGAPLQLLNQWIDNAIAQAIRGYASQQALDVQKRREDYLAAVAHDLRAPLHSVSLVTDVLESAAARPDASFDPARALPLLRRNVQRLNDLVGDVLRENQAQCIPAAPMCRTAQVDVRPLVEKLLAEDGRDSASANDVPDGLHVEADPWLIEKLLRSLVLLAAQAEGAHLRVQGKAAPPGLGVALRLELTWPPADAGGAPRSGVWPLPVAAAGDAFADQDAGHALKALIATQAATVHVEPLPDGEALVLIWAAAGAALRAPDLPDPSSSNATQEHHR